MSWDQLTHPEDLDRVNQTILQAISSQSPYVIEYRITTRCGVEKWLWEKGMGIFGCQGEVLGLQGFITDISELKLTEARLRQTTSELKAIFQALPDLCFRLDSKGTILDYYAGRARDLYVPPDQFLGQRMQDILPPDVATKFEQTLHQVWESEGIDIEYVLPIQNKPQVFEARFIPFMGQQAIMLVRNITERKRVEEEVKLLLTVTQAINDAPDFDAALELSLRKICEATGWDYGEAWIPSAEGSQLERSPAWYTQSSDLYPFREASNHLRFARGQGLSGRVWATLQAEWIPNVCQVSESEFLRVQVAKAVGLKSALAIPIPAKVPEDEQVQPPVLAVLAFFMYEFSPKDTRLVELILAVAGQLGSVIQRKQVEASLKQSNALLLLEQEALRQSKEKYCSIFKHAVEGIFQSTPAGQYISANPALARIYGYRSPTELIESLVDIERVLYVQPNRRAVFRKLMQENDTLSGFESEVYCKDGSIIWISENVRVVRDALGKILHYEGTVEDITEQKHSDQELHRRDALLQGVAAATNYLLIDSEDSTAIAKALAALGIAAGVDRVYIYENHCHITTEAMAMTMRHEWTREEIEPSIYQPHWHNQTYASLSVDHWHELLSSGQLIKGITRTLSVEEQTLLAKDGILSIIMMPILIKGQLWGFIGFDDCSTERHWSKNEEAILQAMASSFGGALKRQQTEAKIRHQALHDQLTQLPNRMLFDDRLSVALSAQRHPSQGAVLFLDLDRFKVINDTLGHPLGDRLLQEATQRLLSCLRQEDTLARWGGDEFTVLLPNLAHSEDVALVVQRILDIMQPPFLLNGHELHVTLSIGVALYPQDGKDEATLLRNADAALYRAKEQGRNTYQFYLPMMNSKASNLLMFNSEIRHALERNEFVLHYQPIVNVQTGKISGIEALIRWQHPERGLLSPDAFIPVAEENNLIFPIGVWALKTACAQNCAWQKAGLSAVRVAVNLSARQFQQLDLVSQVDEVLRETGLAPHYLELEITETAVMQDLAFTRSILHELKEMGVHLSVDDFGTGYSSLGYLKQFPLHTLKIDRTFVQELETNAGDAAIISALIALGKGLNLSVVAEGVETAEQLSILKSLHCQEFQGYLYSRPLIAEGIACLLKAQQTEAA